MNPGQPCLQTRPPGRLSSAKAITAVFDDGTRIRGSCAQVLWRPREGGSRFAVCVGRRLGPAVARNRIKRVLRELIRTEAARIPAGIDFAILPNPRLRVEDWSFPGRREDVSSLLEALAHSVASRS